VIPSLEYLATFLRRTRRPAEAQKVEARAKAIWANSGRESPAEAVGATFLPFRTPAVFSKCA
jgi:hypothetical protein